MISKLNGFFPLILILTSVAGIANAESVYSSTPPGDEVGGPKEIVIEGEQAKGIYEYLKLPAQPGVSTHFSSYVSKTSSVIHCGETTSWPSKEKSYRCTLRLNGYGLIIAQQLPGR